MAIGLHQLTQSASLVRGTFRTPLLPLFGVLTAIEAALVLALPGAGADVVAAMLGDSLLGVFGIGAGALKMLGLVAVLLLLDLFRTSLWEPLHRITVHAARPTLAEIAGSALSRIPALFATQQLIGLFVLGVAAICTALGLSIQTIPHVLVTFTLAPAIYAVVALRRPIFYSVSQAVRITRRNFVAVFSVQGALLAMAYWIAGYFQGAEVTPLVGSYAAVTLLAVYRFASFFGMSTLFLALDAAGDYER